jgi:hypothetical protein
MVSDYDLNQFVYICQHCMSFDHFQKKARAEGRSDEEINSMNITLKTKGQTYSPLIGDPCYRFKRQSKEKFFKNKVAN